MHHIAAQRIWYAVSPSGKGDELILQVSVPCEYRDMGWRCEVSLGIVEESSHMIYGADSWQALQLSLQFAVRRLQYFSGRGWAFYWAKDEDPADPEELIDAPGPV